MTTIHANGGEEFTLCGIAFDAYDSGDVDEPVVMAETGQKVNCADCIRVINFIKTFKKSGDRFIQPPLV